MWNMVNRVGSIFGGFTVCGTVDLGFEFGRDGKIQGTACMWICPVTSTRIRVIRTLLICEVWWDEGNNSGDRS